MESLVPLFTLPHQSGMECRRLRGAKSPVQTSFLGERGEITLNLILLLTTASLLYGGIFWLNKTYEHKTKEHLSDFEIRWNHLSKKYKD